MSPVLGIDFGTAGVRAVVVDPHTGSILGSGEYAYRHTPLYPDPFMARHHLADYLLGLEKAVKDATEELDASRIMGLGLCSTGSSILPVLEDGTALLDLPAHRSNPNAHIWLWKDHTPIEEAKRINDLIRRSYPHYLQRIGSVYSAEWYWSKVLACLRVDSALFREAYTWIEITDYLLFLLSGKTHIDEAIRNICAASHKALYDEGYPPLSFLGELDERLVPLGESLHRSEVRPCNRRSGTLNSEWAKRLGLQEGIPLATGALDAHFGAIGSGVGSGTLVKIVGTSSCDLTALPLTTRLADTEGLSGVVEHSVLPGMWGIEAGQSGVGDIFDWYVNTFL
ncbi:MAG: ribulokinase, partial [Spirochaetales bacterium]|nr:ribulokinase [Spirochaetales bacterium]